MYPDPKPPVDRTGAGDAFSSTFAAAITLGHDIPTALRWGPVNSMQVVQAVGAQAGLATREELEEHLDNAPENYVPTKLEM
jgi:ribokinase